MTQKEYYIDSVQFMINEVVLGAYYKHPHLYSQIIQVPSRDIYEIRCESRQTLEKAEIIFTELNFHTDTCYVIKNRHGLSGIVGLTFLIFDIQESINRYAKIHNIETVNLHELYYQWQKRTHG